MLAHLAHHVITALPVPLSPFIRDEFNLSYARALLIQSVFSWVYGAAQIPAGWLADRIGTRVLLIIGISGLGLAGILIGILGRLMGAAPGVTDGRPSTLFTLRFPCPRAQRRNRTERLDLALSACGMQ